MRVYTVQSPPADYGEAADPIGLVFIREGFSWAALFFPVLWLLFRRLWLWLVIYLVVMIGLSVLAEETGHPLPPLIMIGVHVLFALEANQLRRGKLARGGYRMVGLAAGGTLEEAEIRYFSALEETAARMSGDAAGPAPEPVTPAVATADTLEPEVVGLFPSPEGQTR